MKLQTKISLAILPLVAAVIFALGSWSVLTTTRGIQDSMFKIAGQELKDFVQHVLVENHAILSKHGLENVDSFVAGYQDQTILSAAQIHYHETGRMIILDASGALRFCSRKHHTDDALVWKPAMAKTALHPGTYQTGSVHSERGEENYIGYHFAPWKWTVLYAISTEELSAPGDKIRNVTILAMFLATVAGFLLIFFTHKKFIIHPIGHLMQAAETITAGKSVEQIAVRSGDELDRLARSMETMARAIQDYRTEKENWQQHLETQIAERTFELKTANLSLKNEITAKETISNTLRENERFLRTILDAIQDGICVLDKDLKIVRANRTMTRWYPEMAPLEGKKCHTAFHGKSIPCSNCPSLRAFDSGHIEVDEVNLVIEGKTTGILELYAFPMIDSSGECTGVVEYIRDISSRKKMEDELQKNLCELEKANQKILQQQQGMIEEERLKVLLQMAGATAHELNQPLMALLGNIELMALNRDRPEKFDRNVSMVQESGEKISNIVRKIQTIRHDQIVPYTENTSIIKLDQPLRILAVEDSDEDFSTIAAALDSSLNISLTHARDTEEGYRRLEKESYDLIFLDYLLPDMTGLEFMVGLQRRELDIPVIMVTGQGDEMLASRVIQAGAYDYLPKSKISSRSLSRIIGNAMEKKRLKEEVSRAMLKMTEMSTIDELTGLFNRRYFHEALDREIARAQRYQTEFALFIADLDHFKKINDTYGHPAGDQVLKDIAGILQSSLRKSDVACRYGGEEFTVILPGTSTQDCQRMCERSREKIARHTIDWNGTGIQVRVSIGITAFEPASTDTVQTLIQEADDALYEAKAKGRNRVIVHRDPKIES